MGSLSIRGLTKQFGPVAALRDVSIEFHPGEIHAVLGENGAGKSTLMNVLAGFVRPDQGEVVWDEATLPFGDPAGIRRLGIEMVHQHFMLVPSFTVAENLALARMDRLATPLHLSELVAATQRLADELQWPIDLEETTGRLPVGLQQRVEILKALAGDAQVLILDEPTAVLSPEEVEDLFQVLRRLRDQGKTVLLIAHKLSEIMAVADRATVLRRGMKIGTARIGETDTRTLAQWMVGDLQPPAARQRRPVGATILHAEGLELKQKNGAHRVRGVSLEVFAGEIVGIGGVDGNGQVELAEILAGVKQPTQGHVSGPKIRGYVPQDRQVDGLALSMSIEDNLLISGHRDSSLSRRGWMKPAAIRIWAQQLVDQYKIKIGKLLDSAQSLSGGNQQKIVVSRILSAHPDVIIAVNPTRGLDFRATEFVHSTLALAADRGAAVVVFSTDPDELAALSDRSFIMSGGRLESGSLADVLSGGLQQ